VQDVGRELGARGVQQSSVSGDDCPRRRDEAAQRFVGRPCVESGGVESRLQAEAMEGVFGLLPTGASNAGSTGSSPHAAIPVVRCSTESRSEQALSVPGSSAQLGATDFYPKVAGSNPARPIGAVGSRPPGPAEQLQLRQVREMGLPR
jgi:hypothetical protein